MNLFNDDPIGSSVRLPQAVGDERMMMPHSSVISSSTHSLTLSSARSDDPTLMPGIVSGLYF